MTAGPADPNAPTRTIQFGSVVEDPNRTHSSGDPTAVGAVATPDQSTKSGARTPAPLQYRDPQRYEVIAEHGRGGLGRVLRARDRELGRSVAIKEMLHPGMTSELRFFREALITARLEHPGIVPVHEAGRWPDGTPFYAMKLVAGRSLKEVVDDTRSMSDRLSLLRHVVAVSDAVAYAHSMGVIHRDLKPSNVIVGAYGETIVIDWGLAKDVREQESAETTAGVGMPGSHAGHLTIAGSVLGTPGYMSPEQTSGIADERSDIFALGAMLSYVLRSRPTLDNGEGAHHAAGRPDGVPAPLEAIAAKAMAPAPADRYASAQALGDDLRLYQAGYLVAAHRYSFVQLIHHWTSRNRKLVGVAIIATLALVAILGVSATRVVHARNRAEAERQTLILASARSAVTRDPTKALLWARLYDGPNTVDIQDIVAEAVGRGVARQVLNEQTDMVLMLRPAGPASFLSAGRDGKLRAWTLDGEPRSRVIASDMHEDGVVAYDSTHGSIVRLTLNKAAILTRADGVEREISAPGSTTMALFSPDGSRVLVSSAGTLSLVSTTALGPPLVLRTDVEIGAASWTRNGAEVAGISRDGIVHTWDAQTGTELPRVSIGAFAWADVLESGAIVALRQTGEVWALRDGRASSTGKVPSTCRSFVSSPDEGLLVSPCGNEIVVLSLSTGEIAYRHTSGALVTFPTFSDDGRHMAFADLTGAVWAVNIEEWTSDRFIGHGAPVHAAPTFVGHQLVTGDARGEVRVWNLEDGPANRRRSVAGSGNLRRVATSPDGRRLATDSADGMVRIWSSRGDLEREVVAHRGVIPTVEFSPDGRYVATPGWDGLLHLAPVDAAQHELGRKVSDQQLTGALPVGDAYIVIGVDGRASLWTPRTDDLRPVFEGRAMLQRMDAHNGRVAFGSEDGGVRELDVGSGDVTLLGQHHSAVQGVAYASDGEWAVSADEAGDVLFTARSARGQTHRFASKERTVPAGVAGGKGFAAVATTAGNLRVFALDPSGPRTIATRRALVKRLAVSANGLMLAAICEDGVARLWNLETGDAAALQLSGNVPQDIAFAENDSVAAATTGHDLTLIDIDTLSRVPMSRDGRINFIDSRIATYQSPARAIDEERMLISAKNP